MLSKRTLIVLTTILSVLILVTVFFNSCLPAFAEDSEETHKNEVKQVVLIDTGYRVVGTGYKTVTIDDHDYIVFRGIDCISVIHSESCPCKQKKKK